MILSFNNCRFCDDRDQSMVKVKVYTFDTAEEFFVALFGDPDHDAHVQARRHEIFNRSHRVADFNKAMVEMHAEAKRIAQWKPEWHR